jgi:predicted MPP superfamily phosphohydrolase
MLPHRRAINYTPLLHVTESLLGRISGKGWMAAIANRLGWQDQLRIDRCALTFPGPEHALAPLRIAFASDFHAGPTTHARTLTQACQVLRDLQPDLLLLGGDFVSYRASHIEALAQQLGEVQAPCGRFAVLGNHDLWADDRLIVEHLNRAGIQVLVNQNVQLPTPYSHVWLCGLDDPSSGSPDAAAMFRGAGGCRIVLMHSPQGIPLIEKHAYDLAVCGHTHGGQICLPNGRPIILPSGRYNRRYPSGHFQIGSQPHQRLFVSRGVGYGGLPLRLFAPPDVLSCAISWRHDG